MFRELTIAIGLEAMYRRYIDNTGEHAGTWYTTISRELFVARCSRYVAGLANYGVNKNG